jgi:hypothetical protein
MTFWYPEDEKGYPKIVVGIHDPDGISKAVAEMIEQHGKVDPVNGYSAKEVYCSTYLLESSTNDIICISGKLNTASGTKILIRDEFREEERDEIVSALHISERGPGYKHLVCVWPDTPGESIPGDHLFLRISIQGAKLPKIAGFLRDRGVIDPDNPDTNFLAPYAVYTTGLVVAPTEKVDEYRRVGYFRAIETFATSPPPHPQGIDPNDVFYRNGWFGGDYEDRVVKLV